VTKIYKFESSGLTLKLDPIGALCLMKESQPIWMTASGWQV